MASAAAMLRLARLNADEQDRRRRAADFKDCHDRRSPKGWLFQHSATLSAELNGPEPLSPV
jgi:hypothetical protein